MLKDKIVFITGASSGIGRSAAEIFAKHGAKLILCARRKELTLELAKSLKTKFGTISHTLALDVRDRNEVANQISNLPKSWQEIDILINNAGLAAGLDKIPAGNIDDWDIMIDTNVKGLLYVTRAITPGMVERNSGHVINIGSIAGHEVYANGVVYCATKFAVNAINKGLKMDLSGTNVRVTTVDPGMTETEFSEVRFKGDKSRAKKVYAGLKPLSADEIADAVFYCASRPAHINILELVLMPTAQSSCTIVHRNAD